MPLYEYRCEQCRELIEVLQRFSDEPLTVCEKCGGDLRRLISAPAVQFKGSGWYVTDYAGKSGKGEQGGSNGKKDGGDSSPKDSGGEKSTKKESSGGDSSGSSSSTAGKKTTE